MIIDIVGILIISIALMEETSNTVLSRILSSIARAGSYLILGAVVYVAAKIPFLLFVGGRNHSDPISSNVHSLAGIIAFCLIFTVLLINKRIRMNKVRKSMLRTEDEKQDTNK